MTTTHHETSTPHETSSPHEIPTRRDRLRSTVIVLAVIAALSAPAIFVVASARQSSASFGDNEQVGRNDLSAARLDIEVGASSEPIVGFDLAPGDVRRGSLELVNDGTIDLRYALASTRIQDAAPLSLARWLVWTFSWSDGRACTDIPADGRDAITVTGSDLAAGRSVAGDPTVGADPGDRVLASGESDLLCLQVSFAIEATNDVQSTTISQEFVARAEQALDANGDET